MPRPAERRPAEEGRWRQRAPSGRAPSGTGTPRDGAATTPRTAVVVTGGASGIGRACALGLAAAGRAVAVWDRDGAGARRVANQCADEHGVRAVGSKVDVTVTASLRAAVRRARAELGPVGGLVHAAGIGGAVPVTQIDDESWDEVLDVNLRAGATLTRRAARRPGGGEPGFGDRVHLVDRGLRGALLPAGVLLLQGGAARADARLRRAPRSRRHPGQRRVSRSGRDPAARAAPGIARGARAPRVAAPRSGGWPNPRTSPRWCASCSPTRPPT